jgi:DNA replication and repair protein RecF
LLLLTKISLYQFKNYNQLDFDFNKSIVCITGKNGIGKTNILDAIYYLCFTKSYFHAQENQVQMHDTLGMKIEGLFQKLNNDFLVKCVVRENGKKEISTNGILYTQFSKHMGKFPSVMIAPDDTVLITGSSEHRRKYIDTMLCQVDNAYLESLIFYNKILLQRNAVLKNQFYTPIDYNLLDVYNNRLHEYGTIVFNLRKKYSLILNNGIKEIYKYITDDSEDVHMEYVSSVEGHTLISILQSSMSKDVASMRTTEGIHKDDFIFTIKKKLMKTEASQGQRKSFLFALKLAQHQFLKQLLGIAPILLLDDVFEKLDSQRTEKLLDFITKSGNQCFITDTDEKRVLEGFKIADDVQLIKL